MHKELKATKVLRVLQVLLGRTVKLDNLDSLAALATLACQGHQAALDHPDQLGSLETRDHQVLQDRRVSQVHLGRLVTQELMEPRGLADSWDSRVQRARMERQDFQVTQVHQETLDSRAV